MRRRIARWRRRQRSRVLFVAVPADHCSAIVSSGLCATRRLRMIEVTR